MASTSGYSADEAPQASMPHQRSTVHDLYGLLGVSTPTATTADIRKAYEAMAKELEPELPNKAAQAAFGILTNPAKRAQYDRDRLGYLYAQFKSHEQFPTSEKDESNESREDQIEAYAGLLQDHISDPIEIKEARILALVFQLSTEVEEYKEKSKNVQEEWSRSANKILSMGANVLRELEVCARADIEMLENELGFMRGELPHKNVVGGGHGRISSESCDSEVSASSKAELPEAVNLRSPSGSRLPSDATQLRYAADFGGQRDNSTTSYGSYLTSQSGSSMPVDERVQNYLVGFSTRPTFYDSSTYLDPVDTQRGVEHIVARARRQTLDPEMRNDLAMAQSDKLRDSVERIVARVRRQTGDSETLSDLAMLESDQPRRSVGEKMACVGLDVAAVPAYDPTIKQGEASREQYSDTVQSDEDSLRFAKVCDSLKLHKTRAQFDIPTTAADAQMRKCFDTSSTIDFPHQSPPGLGLVEYQERFGYHVITEDSKQKLEKEEPEKEKLEKETAGGSSKVRPAKRKFPKPWVTLNDSVRMPSNFTSYPTGPYGGPVMPPPYDRGFQQGYQTGGPSHQPHGEGSSAFGAIGSEIKALNEQKAQEKGKTTLDKAAKQAIEGWPYTRKDDLDPFVG